MPTYYVGNLPFSSELWHFGILGMKWGIRRYQNKDGSLTPAGREHYGIRPAELTQERTIPSGTHVYRTTANPDENINGSVYVTYTDQDRDFYKSGWVENVATNANNGVPVSVYENEYVLTKELHIPSREEEYEVINNVVKKNEKNIRETCEKEILNSMMNSWDVPFNIVYESGIDFGMDPAKADKMWEELDTDKNIKTVLVDRKLPKAYAIEKYVEECIKRYKDMPVNVAAYYAASTFGLNPRIRQEVIDELKRRGYNAMTDEAGIGARGQKGYEAENYDPIIIFSGNESMTKTSTSKVDENEKKAADARYHKWYANG